ncbi:hypothetical protein [Streptomyces noursei]|uniref:hypothetical protein n=1 Tax=Streptomyces noursei TaxID=1971 RepID=UPI00045EE256|nr:hypothetical protein DC74_6173 [Streptomyces noursei]
MRALRRRPRGKPRRLYTHWSYNFDKCRLLRKRGITPVIAPLGVGHSSSLNNACWVVEAYWLHQ